MKKKRKKQVHIDLTESKLNKLKAEISDAVTGQALLLVTAFCAEEYDLDDNGVLDLWDSLSRWSEAIADHTITLNTVKKIIEDRTETTIRSL